MIGARTAEETARLERARARIAPLRLYARPLDISRVRLIPAPWLFRLPWFRRFSGYTINNLVLVAMPLLVCPEDLVAHELVHVWQCQQPGLAWVRMWLSYVKPSTFFGDRHGYWANPYEVEARSAVERTTGDPSG